MGKYESFCQVDIFNFPTSEVFEIPAFLCGIGINFRLERKSLREKGKKRPREQAQPPFPE
ncbi:MAG: hypothetical protein K6E31_02260 [bacterium]|jgi:hypothetical protein|nr:hypothetical protein [bacterium]